MSPFKKAGFAGLRSPSILKGHRPSRIAGGLFVATLALFSAGCDRPEGVSDASQPVDPAARVVFSSVRLDAWPNGAIPYVFSTEIHEMVRADIRAAMNVWQAGSEGRVSFFEVANTYSGPKLTIRLVSSELLDGQKVAAYVSGKPSTGMSMNLVSRHFTYPYLVGTIGVVGGQFEVLLHELGHVLGLAHEQTNPGVRSVTTAHVTGDRSGCKEDLYKDWQTLSTSWLEDPYFLVVPSTAAQANEPDLNSVMISVGYLCPNGASVQFRGLDGTVVGSQHNGPTVGDFQAVKAIYTLPSVSRLWNVNAPIQPEFAYMCNTSYTCQLPSEKNAYTNFVSQLITRWVGALDPRTGALASAPMMKKVVSANSPAPTSGNTIRFVVDPNFTGVLPWTVSCNSETNPSYCVIRLDSKMFTNSYPQPISTPDIMIQNVMQAAIGEALGLSTKSIQSAVYENNAWAVQQIFPTARDIEALRAKYGRFNDEVLPLIKVSGYGSPGSMKFQFLTGWSEVEKLPKLSIQSANMVGRVLRQGSPLANATPSAVSMNFGRSISQYTLGYQALWGTQTLASLAQAQQAAKGTVVCPTEAIQSAQSVQTLAAPATLPMMTTSSTGLFTRALTAGWNETEKVWDIPSSPIQHRCIVTLGYIAY